MATTGPATTDSAPIASASAGAAPTTAAPVDVAEGKPTPAFSVTASDGTKIDSAAMKGKPIVLYFYPKDETPGCTKEACDFRDHHAALDSAGVVLLGVSTDDLDSHHHFQEKEHLPFPLLADVDTHVSRLYGVYKPHVRDGKTLMGIERTTFVIDKSGKIARVWPKVAVIGHVEDVLAFVRGS